MHGDSCPLDYKVYVGNLVNKPELERAFGDYGPLQSVWLLETLLVFRWIWESPGLPLTPSESQMEENYVAAV